MRTAMRASLYFALALTTTTSFFSPCLWRALRRRDASMACRCSSTASPAYTSTISSFAFRMASILKKGPVIRVMASMSRRRPQGSVENTENSRRLWLARVVWMPAIPGKSSFPPPLKPFMGWGEQAPMPMRTSQAMYSRFTSTSAPAESTPTFTRCSKGLWL